MSSANSRKQLSKNVISLTLVQIANYVLPLLSVPVISRIIGPEKYGAINFAAAFIMYFTLLISYSFDFTATRKIVKNPEDEENRNIVFSEVFYTQCLLFIFATVAFTLILFLIPEFEKNKPLFIFSFLVCLATLFTQNWLFQAMQDLSKVALFNLISKLLFTVSILLVVRENKDYIWQPFLIGSIQTAVALWSFKWAIKNYKIKFIEFSLKRCFQVLGEEKTMFYSLVFVNLYSSTNTVFLGLFQSGEQVGYYTAAQRLIIIAISVLTVPLSQAFYPFIGKAFGESQEKGLQVAQKLIPLIIVFIGLATIIMFLLGPVVIRLFYGPKFEPAIPVFQILAFVPLLFALNNVLGIQILVNLGMDKHFLKISACAAVISIVLNLLMTKQLGYMGTAFNWLITEIFLFASMYVVLRRKGLNPINLKHFNRSALTEHFDPLIIKFLSRVGRTGKKI